MATPSQNFLFFYFLVLSYATDYQDKFHQIPIFFTKLGPLPIQNPNLLKSLSSVSPVSLSDASEANSVTKFTFHFELYVKSPSLALIQAF